MATTTTAASTPDEPNGPGRQPIPPAKRRMLQQCFEHGSKSSAQGQYDYATQMFTQCVVGDPSNLLYTQNFVSNLQKKYNNNKTGAKLASVRSAGAKTAVKNSARKKDWLGVIAGGLKVLELNPWDASALADMAGACDQLHFEEAQIVYLKAALDADIKDIDCNRLLGRALGKLGQFDQAIACWMRVQQGKPNDEEAHRAIANLTVEKTIHKGGYEDAESSTQVMVDKQAQAERQGHAGPSSSPEEQLEKKLKRDPANMSLYLELADLHLKEDRYEQAEEVLQRALQASGGAVEMRERLEDAQLRRARHHLAMAEKKAKAEDTPEAKSLYQQMWTELNNTETTIYRSRCERYPQNLGFKYELGVRLRRGKNFQEAIKVLQEARTDTKRRGLVFLELGVCFESIKQYKLALSNYEQAVEALGEREVEQRKTAVYRAGCLAMDRLKDWDAAEKYLTMLASIDFGYKDVGERLDKLPGLRDDDGSN